MSPATLIIILLALSSLAYYVGRRQAIAVGRDKIQLKQLRSRPTYYGALTAIWCGVPALLIFGFWLTFESNIITQVVVSDLPENIRNLPAARLNLIVNDIRNLVSGNIVSGEIDPTMHAAADHYRSLKTTGNAGLAANLTVNPLKTVTTVTGQIVTLLVGDQEFDSPKTLAAFALGLLLFIVTLILIWPQKGSKSTKIKIHT